MVDETTVSTSVVNINRVQSSAFPKNPRHGAGHNTVVPVEQDATVSAREIEKTEVAEKLEVPMKP